MSSKTKDQLEIWQIVKRCLAGENKAKKELYSRYSRQMFSICRRYIKNDDMAQDVFQEGFYKVFKNLNKIKDPKAVSGWIKSVFVNEALTYLRKNKRFKFEVCKTPPLDSELHSINDALSKLNSEYIIEIIKKLPPRRRAVFNLYIIEGYSHKEIADKLDITENTSKSQLRDARIFLQNKLINQTKMSLPLNLTSYVG